MGPRGSLAEIRCMRRTHGPSRHVYFRRRCVMRDDPSRSAVLGVVACVALLASVASLAQQSPAAPGCLPGRAAWIAGVALGASPREVERRLGPPDDREVGYGEDDGGRYEEILLSYAGVDVFVVRGVVDRVITTHPASCTAGGICPGMNDEQVRERLARSLAKPVASSPTSLALCPEEHFLSDYYLLIYYTPAGAVAKLELVLDRP